MAITRNRAALLRVLAALFAMAGLGEGAMVATLPRHLRNHVLRLLRPAESAVRRLVLIAARDLVVVVPARSKQATTTTTTTTTSKPPHSVILGLEPRTHSVKPAVQARTFSLPLLDPRKRFPLTPPRRRAKSFPRITFIGLTEPAPIPDGWIPSPDDPVSAARLCRRLHAVRRALDDLDGQAKRLARWRARRDLALTAIQGEFAPARADGQRLAAYERESPRLKGANHRYRRFNPMRPGWPPGRRKRPIHAVDDILRECHVLALALERDSGRAKPATCS